MEPILPSLREDNVAVWVLGGGPYPPDVLALQDLLDAASEELEPEDVWEPQDMSDTCLYIFTSGTTGAGRGWGDGVTQASGELNTTPHPTQVSPKPPASPTSSPSCA